MNERFIRTPKYLLRVRCIEDATRNWNPSQFLEIGAGRGYLTAMFLGRGYSGACYDLGEQTRSFLRQNLSKYGDRIQVVESLEHLQAKSFDCLFAFEVLEHIQDDLGSLRLWSTYLKRGGRVLVTVPAHMRKYHGEDAFVGHIRRYEKSELQALLRDAGYRQITILNYGFPLGNLTRAVGKLIHQDRSDTSLSMEEKSIMSGMERSEEVKRLSFLVHESFIVPFALLQRLFYQKDWGDGYVAYAEKS